MYDTEHIAPAAADGVSHQLDPRWIAYRRRVAACGAAFAAAALAVAVAAAVLIAEIPALPLAAGALLLLIASASVGLWWPTVAYRHSSYRLSTRGLEIRRGVLWRSVIDVPRSRIQHSDVSQGPFERLHGLGTLSVYTAGTSHALVRLHGLDHQRALSIRAHLLQADDEDVI